MAYCARTDLEARIGAERVAALADHDNDGNETGSAVDDACTAATEVMDGWLSAVLDTPVDSAEYPAVKHHGVSIALWKLAVGKGGDPDGTEAGLKAEHDEAMRWVMAVGKGQLRLNKVAEAAPGQVKISSRERKYTPGFWDRY